MKRFHFKINLAFPIKQKKIMKACCKDFGVPTDLCLSKNDVHSKRSPIMLHARKEVGQDLLKVIENCYSISISPDAHGDNDNGKQILLSLW